MNNSFLQAHRKAFIITGVAVCGVLAAGALYLRADPVGDLARQLQDADAQVRYRAAKRLEELGPNAHAAVAELSTSMSDADPRVRYRSVKAISKMGELAAAAVPSLMEGLKDPDRDVRYYCAKSLYKIGEAAEPARDAVVEALSDKDAEIRCYLLKALSEIGEEHEPSVQAVGKLLKDPNQDVRKAAQNALEDMQDWTALLCLPCTRICVVSTRRATSTGRWNASSFFVPGLSRRRWNAFSRMCLLSTKCLAESAMS